MYVIITTMAVHLRRLVALVLAVKFPRLVGRGQALWSFWCYWVALQNLFYELCNLDLIWIECFLSICVLPQDDPAFCHIAPGRSREGTVLCLL